MPEQLGGYAPPLESGRESERNEVVQFDAAKGFDGIADILVLMQEKGLTLKNSAGTYEYTPEELAHVVNNVLNEQIANHDTDPHPHNLVSLGQATKAGGFKNALIAAFYDTTHNTHYDRTIGDLLPPIRREKPTAPSPSFAKSRRSLEEAQYDQAVPMSSTSPTPHFANGAAGSRGPTYDQARYAQAQPMTPADPPASPRFASGGPGGRGPSLEEAAQQQAEPFN